MFTFNICEYGTPQPIHFIFVMEINEMEFDNARILIYLITIGTVCMRSQSEPLIYHIISMLATKYL